MSKSRQPPPPHPDEAWLRRFAEAFHQAATTSYRRDRDRPSGSTNKGGKTPTYLIINRPPQGYAPSPDAAKAWSQWFADLGDDLLDPGNPTFSTRSLGAAAADTRLGGYTLVTAPTFDDAMKVAGTCPVLADGGSVEVGEVTELNLGRTGINKGGHAGG